MNDLPLKSVALYCFQCYMPDFVKIKFDLLNCSDFRELFSLSVLLSNNDNNNNKKTEKNLLSHLFFTVVCTVWL